MALKIKLLKFFFPDRKLQNPSTMQNLPSSDLIHPNHHQINPRSPTRSPPPRSEAPNPRTHPPTHAHAPNQRPRGKSACASSGTCDPILGDRGDGCTWHRSKHSCFPHTSCSVGWSESRSFTVSCASSQTSSRARWREEEANSAPFGTY